MARGCVDKELSAHAADGFFTGRIDIGDHRGVGERQSAPEILLQCLRARIAVRLEQKKNTRASRVAGGAEHGGDFRRMVSVIVNDEKIRRSEKCLEAPTGSAEGFERFGADGEIESEFGGERERRAGIDRVMLAGDIQGDAREFLVTAIKSKNRT